MALDGTDPDDTNAIQFRLTTVIEADQRIDIPAEKRIASPTKFARERTADGKDHFQWCGRHEVSLYGTGSGRARQPSRAIRDDTDAATAHASQLRDAHEFPTLAGSATVPFITDYYRIGDRVQIIDGRDA